MKARIVAVLTAVAAAVLVGAQPAAAAPAIRFSDLSVSAEFVDTTARPSGVEVIFTVTTTDPAAREISGIVELRQFAGDSAIGPPTRIPYESPLTDLSTTIRGVRAHIPQYGATAEAVWRVTEVTARDGRGNDRTLRGSALEEYGAEVAVRQLVDSGAPGLDQVALWPGQSADVVDVGAGVEVNYRVTVTDLQAGLWKGRLVLAGPDGQRLSTAFAVASDGRHLTCGTGSLINDIYDHVECFVPVSVPAEGTWTVQRVALTDRAENTRLLGRPAGPVVTVTRG